MGSMIRTALETEWYNGNLDEKAYNRLLRVLDSEPIQTTWDAAPRAATEPHTLLFPPHPDGFFGSSALCSCGEFQWDGDNEEQVTVALRPEVILDWQYHAGGAAPRAATEPLTAAHRVTSVTGNPDRFMEGFNAGVNAMTEPSATEPEPGSGDREWAEKVGGAIEKAIREGYA